MKFNRKFLNLLSYVLVISMLLQLVFPACVYADSKGNAIQELPMDLGEHEIEKILETYSDQFSANNAGDWSQADADGVARNFFHNEVQDYIYNNSNRTVGRELSIVYSKEQLESDKKLKRKTGRADLYSIDERYIYLWEVKPASYSMGLKRKSAIKQLERYVNSKPGKYIKGADEIESASFQSSNEKYMIKFLNMGDGLILYWFFRIPDEEKETAKETMPAEEKNKAYDAIQVKVKTEPGFVFDKKLSYVQTLTVAAKALGTAYIVYNISAPTAKTNSASAVLNKRCLATIIVLGGFLANPSEAAAKEIQDEIYDFYTIINCFYTPEYIEEMKNELGDRVQFKIDEAIRIIQEYFKEYEEAGEAQPPRDPLIIDFGTEGIELKALEHGVNFDLDNNGFAEKTAWIGTEDAFLALDRNGNGKIDNGGELFGDQVILKDGSKSVSGFEALKELDDNGDGMIDSDDADFDRLLVWTDKNHNGKSETEELTGLNEAGIKSVSLDFSETSIVDDETGTRIAETADVTIEKAGKETVTQISEFWFPVNPSDTTQGDVVTAGNVPDIMEAARDDESGILYEYLKEFSTLNDISEKRYYLKKILYFITDAGDIDPDSRGGNIDARDLKVIEQFMGHDFIGVDGTNPNVNAAAILKEIYAGIENRYYNILNMYGALGAYQECIYEYEDENGCKKLDLLFLNYIVDSKIEDGEDVDTLLYDIGVYLYCFDMTNGTDYLGDFEERYSAVSTHYADIIKSCKSGITYIGTDSSDYYNGTGQHNFMFGLEGNDSLSGSDGNDCINGGDGDDMISGGAGNDDLSGKEGNDTLDGGAGNDILKGGMGDDTYIFSRGYGKDTVIDVDGENTLYFKDINVKDIRVNFADENSALVSIKGTDDTFLIRYFCMLEDFQNYMLKFEDATMHATDENSPFHYIYGSEGDDVIGAVVDDSYMYGFDGNDRISGSDGDDFIYGGKGDDRIYAGYGDDIIFAGEGDDILDGGEGDDKLYGGEGNDIYIFGRNYGKDVINDEEGETTVRLKGDSLSELDICQVGESAVISIKDTDDRLIISNYMENRENYFLKTDEERLLLTELISSSDSRFYSGSDGYDYYENKEKEIIAGGGSGDRIIGADSAEYVLGESGDDQILMSGGNDVIFGGAGNDYINGGEGDDYIDVGKGDDFSDGGNGDDCYIFCQGYGKDSIMDSEGNNIILFGEGLSADSIKAYRSNWNDLLITFDGIKDTLTIKNYCINEKARGFRLVFADGTVVPAADKESPLRTIYGTDGSEYMDSIYTDGITKIGQDGDDQLVGSSGRDFLYGGRGNDRITGGVGDDVLDGGDGNDYLYGQEGNDRYIFKQGYGKDTIGDGNGVNTIEIYGYTPNDIKAYRTNWNNLTITFKDSEDSIIIEGFFNSEADRNYYLSFNGGLTVHATASNSPLRTIYGTEDGEYILAMDDGGVTIYGEAGNDNLNGGNGNDGLYGGNGDDQLYGKNGNDILDGGKGDDFLYGGAGKDTYIFDKGYGKDTIADSEGVSMIEFGEGITATMIKAYRTNWNDLTITFKGIGDKLVIKDYFTSENNRKYSVSFADGTVFNFEDKENPIRKVHATEYSDWMSAWSDDGIILYGEGGDDHLEGGKGDDILSGGEGNDYLGGKAGDDTYFIDKDCGHDTIEDNKGENRVIFNKVSHKEVTFKMKNNGDLLISVNGTKDIVTVKSFKSEFYIFEFANGVIGTVDEKTGGFVK